MRKPYWIKERNNPQLGTYFLACGRMSTAEAKRNETPLYGSNIMIRFDSKEEYEAECKKHGLRAI